MIKTETTVCIGVDVGGTFTDFLCVRSSAAGNVELSVYKTPSTPHAPELAVLDGLAAMGVTDRILQIVHGSTVATNALLQRKGARTAFVTNRGFGDLLTLARQTRPHLYALEYEPAPPPVASELCLETGGRVSADGATIDPLSASDLAALIERLHKLKVESVAINLLFSFLDPSHEEAIESALREALPGVFISRSSLVLPEYKEYERGMATWLNAFLGPVVSGYLHRLRAGLEHLPAGSSLQVMQSSGETISAGSAADSAVNLLLSGPAGGLAAVEYLGRQIGQDKLISFDMGGTSTDVALLDGPISITSEGQVGEFPVSVPMVDMHTIGAGGGSIAYVDSGGMLQVGPESAGSDPGPACYGKGGTRATVTDANLLLGRIDAERFLGGRMKLDVDRARRYMKTFADSLGISGPESGTELAKAIIEVANSNMERAIRVVSVERGHDPRDFALLSFGGAGAQHACELAERLEIATVIVPPHAGVLSALGMLAADCLRDFSQSMLGRDAASVFEELEARAAGEFAEEGLPDAVFERSLDLRYRGQSYEITLPFAERDNFHEAHRKLYGYDHHDQDVEAVTARVKAVAPLDKIDLAAPNETDSFSTTYVPGGWHEREDSLGNTILTRE